jgi:hypothetical protein
MRIKPDLLVSPFFVGTLCGLMLWVDVVPGKVGHLIYSAFESASAVVGIASLSVVMGTIGWLVWTIVQLIRRKIRFWTNRVYLPLISLLFVMLTCTAIAYHVPTKAGFLVSYRQFQRAIVTNAVQDKSRVGLFRIERVVYPSKLNSSNKGKGVHFQLLSSSGGTGASYYGISYRPDLNSGKMPFGFITIEFGGIGISFRQELVEFGYFSASLRVRGFLKPLQQRRNHRTNWSIA